MTAVHQEHGGGGIRKTEVSSWHRDSNRVRDNPGESSEGGSGGVRRLSLGLQSQMSSSAATFPKPEMRAPKRAPDVAASSFRADASWQQCR